MRPPVVEEWSLPRAVDRIADMRRRLRDTRFPASACEGWSGGVDVRFLRRFAAYLADDYSWETDSGRFGGRHLLVRVATDGDTDADLRVHVHLPLGGQPGAGSLVLLHGWPSSGLEFVHVARYLGDGGAYPVLVDLPGFGFSDPTQKPIGPRAMAGLLKRVLVDGLGLGDMVVHGNDWGSTVASWLAIDHPEILRGIHLSMMGLKPQFADGAPKLDDAELAWIKVVQKRLAADAGYREIQGTKPNTAAIGISDSPAALAAWIAEKLHDWNGGDVQGDPPVPLADLAAIVTGYWISGNIASANWIYAAVRGEDDTVAPAGGTGDVPVGFSLFGNGFFPAPPESWARRVHRVADYAVHNAGGHYPALTRPEALADDMLRFYNAFH